jgi:hypothetical protein
MIKFADTGKKIAVEFEKPITESDAAQVAAIATGRVVEIVETAFPYEKSAEMSVKLIDELAKIPGTQAHAQMLVDDIVRYESGEMTEREMIDFFGQLVKNGMAWSLQGHYGRTARDLMSSGLIDRDGNVNQDEVDFYSDLAQRMNDEGR